MAFCRCFAGELNKWTSHSIWAASALAFYSINGTDGMFPTVHFYRLRNLRFIASVALFTSPPAAAEQWQHGALVWRDPWKSWFKLKSVHATPLQASSLGREVITCAEEEQHWPCSQPAIHSSNSDSEQQRTSASRFKSSFRIISELHRVETLSSALPY